MNSLHSSVLEFTIYGPPIPWKAPYVGTRGAFSPRTKIMNDFKQILSLQYRGPILETALSCIMIFYMPIPKSISKKKKEQMIDGSIRPTKIPDLDNLRKFYSDCLQDCVIKNDCFIVEGWSEKRYDLCPRTVITLRELNATC